MCSCGFVGLHALIAVRKKRLFHLFILWPCYKLCIQVIEGVLLDRDYNARELSVSRMHSYHVKHVLFALGKFQRGANFMGGSR